LDPTVRFWLGLSIAAGVVSSVGMAKAYSQLTDTEEDDNLRFLAKAGGIAVATSAVVLAWKWTQVAQQAKWGLIAEDSV